MEEIIKEIINDVTSIEAIGHHELKRHLVYKVETRIETYVIKFYYLDKRYYSEVKALELLSTSNLPVVKVLKHGLYKRHHYMVYRFEEGRMLDEVNDIEASNLFDIYMQAGHYLKEIHTYGRYEPYGRTGLDEYKSLKASMHYEIDRIYTHLKGYEHLDESIIEAGVNFLERYKSFIGEAKKGLCHMDYGSRNILVRKTNNRYEIVKIIDFEQATISDVRRDLVNVYHKNLKDSTLLKAFSQGYKEDIFETIHRREVIAYHLHFGLSICSWSLPVAKDYYQEGIEILRTYTRDGVEWKS